MKMKICPKCGDIDAFGINNYCYKDGAKLIEVPVCKCGKELIDIYKFCPKCGVEIKKES